MTTFTLPRLDEDLSQCGGSFGVLESPAGNLPLQQLHYQVQILGLDTQTVITQTYYNPFNEFLEATYVFPIEGGQAVTHCEMRVGERVVLAELKERGQARRDYRQALALGQRAALLEENRSELFSMKVGNIPPGEAVQVRLYTVGHLPVVRGEWTLRLPLVVAPRYTSGFPLPRKSVEKGITPDTDQVPDASALTPPTWLPGFASPVELQIRVDLDLGNLCASDEYVRQLRSSLHTVLVEPCDSPDESARKIYRLTVAPGERVDRDFILRGDIDDAEPRATLVLEPPSRAAEQLAVEANGQSAAGSSAALATFALHLVPPRSNKPLARDIIFLLDRSGSMEGWKVETAKRGISRLIDTLGDEDRFTVLAFDNEIEMPEGEQAGSIDWLPATDVNRYKVISWLARFDARGGTEMGMALQRALLFFKSARPVDQAPNQSQQWLHSRAIVLVTDGQITGEDSILQMLGMFSEAERPRIYCLGVDSAVNGSVLKRLADYSDGTFELAESERRMTEVLTGFAHEIGNPAITGLEVEVVDQPDASRSIVPSQQQSLYFGRCHRIYGRAAADKPLQLTVRGKQANGSTWSESLTAQYPTATDRPLLMPLWGRKRVRELEDQLVANYNHQQRLRDEIIATSLQCNVLCRYTAFVAVDAAERVDPRANLHTVMQPVEWPEGWQMRPLPRLSQEDLIAVPRRDIQGMVQQQEMLESLAEQEALESSLLIGDAPVGRAVAASQPRDAVVGLFPIDGAMMPFVSRRPVFSKTFDIDPENDPPWPDRAITMNDQIGEQLIGHGICPASDSEPEPPWQWVAVRVILEQAVRRQAAYVILVQGDEQVELNYIVGDSPAYQADLPASCWESLVGYLEKLVDGYDYRGNEIESGFLEFTVGGTFITCTLHFARIDSQVSVLIDLVSAEKGKLRPVFADLPPVVQAWWQQWKLGVNQNYV